LLTDEALVALLLALLTALLTAALAASLANVEVTDDWAWAAMTAAKAIDIITIFFIFTLNLMLSYVCYLFVILIYSLSGADHRFLAVCPFSGSSVANAIDICGICRRIRWHMSRISVAYAANVISLW
jgi:hypothetical protein